MVISKEFIETENAFHVMAVLKQKGIIDKSDILKAAMMNREEWLKFMFDACSIKEDIDDN